LFSDGFTAPEIIAKVADQAAELYDSDGITVSVIATGEGAAPALEKIAVSGHGRFYPGRDLQQVPQVIAEEAVIASRDFITEGTFLPEITAATRITEPLVAAPPLLGYVATTAKGTATTSLRIGPDRDPLLASWQAGLGRVSSWTSDASQGWSKNWATWDGYVDFWSSVVKDTFPAGDTAGAAQAALGNGRLEIDVSSADPFPDGATATAVVAGPDGQRSEVTLERTADGQFSVEVAASRAGSYAVGVTVQSAGETLLSSATLASESYPAEYRPGNADAAALGRLSALTGGRGEIDPGQSFDSVGLTPATESFGLRVPLLIAAAVLWPLAVLLSRLSLRGASLGGAVAGVRRRSRRLASVVPRIVPKDPVNLGASSTQRPDGEVARRAEPPASTSPPAGAVSELLTRKRARQAAGSGTDDDAD
jgi:hypothetical protein